MSDGPVLTLAVPSKGGLEEPTLALMNSCGLEVRRPNPRQYEAFVASDPRIKVVFQRAADIVPKVEEGSPDIGITGLDLLHEHRPDSGNAVVLIDDLGFGRCRIVLAAPESWVDVDSVSDLASLASEFKAQGRELRVATKFPNLVWQFLHDHGVHYFRAIESHGALELAPSMGFADVIADIVSTGVTLRDNRLKPLRDGVVMQAQACLIGNRVRLRDPDKLEVVRHVLEAIEGRLKARRYFSITANVRGSGPEEVAAHVTREGDLAGMTGPTISPVYSKDPRERGWFAVTVVVERERLFRAVGHLRAVGGQGITVFPAEYVFGSECQAYERLLGLIRRRDDG